LAAEIIDIRRFNGRSFLPILRREGQVWASDLRWDYTNSEATIVKILEERRLSGFAMVEASAIQGYCFFFYEGEKGLIGNLFVEPSCPQVEYAERLLDHTLETLLATPGIHRVETQLPHFSLEALEPSFRAHGFKAYLRRFMILNFRKSKTLPEALTVRPGSPSLPSTLLRDAERSRSVSEVEGRAVEGTHAEVEDSERSRRGQPTAGHGDLEITTWERSLDRQAAQLIYITYRQHVDALINDQYASETGAARLIENIVQHRGCGDAVPGASRAAVHRPTRKLAGLLAITAVRPRTAHIPQIAVAPEFQGAGLGTQMMAAGFAECMRKGFEEISLTVTDANSGAVRLYERLGFETFRTFGAFVWEQTR
jgi:ribosomal protein S18 acetylase RimI-like enzyme